MLVAQTSTSDVTFFRKPMIRAFLLLSPLVSDPVAQERSPALLRPSPVRSQSLVDRSSPGKFVKPKVLEIWFSYPCTGFFTFVSALSWVSGGA